MVAVEEEDGEERRGNRASRWSRNSMIEAGDGRSHTCDWSKKRKRNWSIVNTANYYKFGGQCLTQPPPVVIPPLPLPERL